MALIESASAEGNLDASTPLLDRRMSRSLENIGKKLDTFDAMEPLAEDIDDEQSLNTSCATFSSPVLKMLEERGAQAKNNRKASRLADVVAPETLTPLSPKSGARMKRLALIGHGYTPASPEPTTPSKKSGTPIKRATPLKRGGTPRRRTRSQDEEKVEKDDQVDQLERALAELSGNTSISEEQSNDGNSKPPMALCSNSSEPNSEDISQSSQPISAKQSLSLTSSFIDEKSRDSVQDPITNEQPSLETVRDSSQPISEIVSLSKSVSNEQQSRDSYCQPMGLRMSSRDSLSQPISAESSDVFFSATSDTVSSMMSSVDISRVEDEVFENNVTAQNVIGDLLDSVSGAIAESQRDLRALKRKSRQEDNDTIISPEGKGTTESTTHRIEVNADEDHPITIQERKSRDGSQSISDRDVIPTENTQPMSSDHAQRENNLSESQQPIINQRESAHSITKLRKSDEIAHPVNEKEKHSHELLPPITEGDQNSRDLSQPISSEDDEFAQSEERIKRIQCMQHSTEEDGAPPPVRPSISFIRERRRGLVQKQVKRFSEFKEVDDQPHPSSKLAMSEDNPFKKPPVPPKRHHQPITKVVTPTETTSTNQKQVFPPVINQTADQATPVVAKANQCAAELFPANHDKVHAETINQSAAGLATANRELLRPVTGRKRPSFGELVLEENSETRSVKRSKSDV